MKLLSWIKRLRKNLARKLPPEETEGKHESKKRTEKLLLVKLKVLSYVLLAFAVFFFCYALSLQTPDEKIDVDFSYEELLSEPCAHEVLNFSAISLIFLCLGATCLYISKKQNSNSKKK